MNDEQARRLREAGYAWKRVPIGTEDRDLPGSYGAGVGEYSHHAMRLFRSDGREVSVPQALRELDADPRKMEAFHLSVAMRYEDLDSVDVDACLHEAGLDPERFIVSQARQAIIEKYGTPSAAPTFGGDFL